MKRSSKILAMLGILLIAMASVVRFTRIPYASKLPKDTGSTAHYRGEASRRVRTMELPNRDLAGASR